MPNINLTSDSTNHASDLYNQIQPNKNCCLCYWKENYPEKRKAGFLQKK